MTEQHDRETASGICLVKMRRRHKRFAARFRTDDIVSGES
jgi:hypothetical protein